MAPIVLLFSKAIRDIRFGLAVDTELRIEIFVLEMCLISSSVEFLMRVPSTDVLEMVYSIRAKNWPRKLPSLFSVELLYPRRFAL